MGDKTISLKKGNQKDITGECREGTGQEWGQEWEQEGSVGGGVREKYWERQLEWCGGISGIIQNLGQWKIPENYEGDSS